VLLREVEYAKPASVADALALLAANDGARALAGGQTLINVMKARAASPDMLVDLNGLEELKGIELGSDGTLTIGAMATYTDIVGSAESRARPILGEVCSTIADVQVRNRGTIGGNICANDPTNHLPPLLVALDATMTIAGSAGERTVSADDFFLGVYMTAAGPGEILTLTLAQTVYLVPWSVLALPVAMSVFPALATAHATGDQPAYRRDLAGATRSVLLLSAFGAAALIAAAGPIGRLFAATATAARPDPEALRAAVIAFAPGLIGYGLYALHSRAQPHPAIIYRRQRRDEQHARQFRHHRAEWNKVGQVN